MVERIKNKKGFTIIEVMVVIALIGILAAVLVPQFGGVRDTARTTGVITNVKTVEAFVASVIDNYAISDFNDLDTDITGQFDGTPVTLTNPYTGETASISVTVADTAAHPATGTAGLVYVVIDDDTLDVFINGMDAAGQSIDATERVIER